MDAIQAVRELGKAIQEDERYIEYAKAKKANDEDVELQNLIGEFNLIRQNAAMEYNKPEEEQNKEKLQELNAKMQEAYEKVMTNEYGAVHCHQAGNGRPDESGEHSAYPHAPGR